MKRMRKLHFWIGLIASVFIFIQSATGIYMYFSGKGPGERIEGAANFRERSFGRNDDTGNVQNGQDIQAGNSDFNQRGAATNGQFFQDRNNGGLNSLSKLVKELHTGVIGLIGAIAMLILTGTGLCISFVMLRAKWRVKRQKDITA
ncbi:PepSY domain-containing protein [Bacillus sp. 3103sda1]|uniref:PepSY domain-containing protein n=1 Tax=Bacillus sp. 3103sda1 TaxID=2953808 RepID=UPI00209FA4CB|nr:PepSY domain-containing protein [Bacillus sp. 3103sda1]MCP1122297.1 PepSY domain-containing protein [Bacillus sp. 3103sda1]